MDVRYEARWIQRLCDDSSTAQRKLGAQSARKLRLRLLELMHAKDLSEISHLPPQRLHRLRATSERLYAVSLHGGHRLVFRIAEPALEQAPVGEIDPRLVRTIVITFVGDYHDG